MDVPCRANPDKVEDFADGICAGLWMGAYPLQRNGVPGKRPQRHGYGHSQAVQAEAFRPNGASHDDTEDKPTGVGK